MFMLMLLLLAPYNNICTVLFAPNGKCDQLTGSKPRYNDIELSTLAGDISTSKCPSEQ